MVAKKKLPAGYYDPADYIMVHKDYYADLMYMLRSAHEELTNHGHQELSECGCKIASALKTKTESSFNPEQSHDSKL